jgi:putative transcriptional regulator
MRNWVRYERAKKRISQEELGKALEVSRHAIIGVETERYEPSCELAMKIAKYFNKRVEDIFFLSDEDMPKL